MNQKDRTIPNVSAEPEIGSLEWQSLIVEGARQLNIPLHPDQANRFAVHARELDLWNRKMNLTAIKSPLDVAVKHYLDSIVPAAFIQSGASLLDVGSGAGFPGIPLKILNPSLSVTLIDASRKKVSFLNHVIRKLALENTSARHIRTEQLVKEPAYLQIFDVISCRAFSSLRHFIWQVLPLLKPNGVMLAMKGKEIESELRELGMMPDGNPPVKLVSDDGSPVFLKLKVFRYVLPYLDVDRLLMMLRVEK